MVKIGRNDECACGSGKKYKKCCLNKKAVQNSNDFVLSKEIYERDFVPHYHLEILEPKIIFEWSIVLPFHIPVPEGITSTINATEAYYSFRFEAIKSDESHKYLVENHLGLLDKEYSKVNIIVATDISFQEGIEQKEELLNHYYDNSLELLNEFILAYIVSGKDLDCHYITKEMLASQFVYRIIDLESWDKSSGLFLLHWNVPYLKEELSQQKLYDLVRIQSVVTFEKNPFVNVESHISSSKRYFKNGFYQESVIYAQISIDVFVRQLYKALLKEVENFSDDEIEEAMEINFMKIIKSKLSQFLGGRWDITREGTDLYNWHNDTYLLRNRIVHAGVIPSFSEAEKAIESAIKFRLYVIKLIQSKKGTMPLLNSYFTINDA